MSKLVVRSWYASKAIWLGITMTVVSVLSLIAGEEWIQSYPIIVSALGTISGILTIGIRQWTEVPLNTRRRTNWNVNKWKS